MKMPDRPPQDMSRPKKLAPIFRALVEAGFIVFLYYSNLLMGEYEGSGQASGRGFLWAVRDIFTETNFMIAVITAFIGYLVFEFLRKRV
jgi:hypothetical protein